MMRRKRKMAWSVALSAAMAAGLLAGCGSNGGAESTSGSTAASSAKTESSAGDTADTSDRPTYKIATVRWTDTWPTDFLHEGVMKEIEDKMNINIDWQVYYNSDWSEQKSLLLASGDLPDAFLGSICLTQADMAQNKSAFLDLTDLIEKDMPNLKAAFEADPELKAVCTSRDGRIYSLPKKLPLRPKVCGDVMCINQEWLDALNLETPSNVEELTEVLRAFKTGDPNGNGQADEIPLEMGLDIGFNGIRYMLPLFGASPATPDKWIYIDDDKKVQFLATQDGFRDCMEWLHMLYEEGLVDPEIVSQDFNTVETKLKEGNVGFFTAWRLLAMAYDDGVASNSVLWTPDSSASLYRYLELCKPGAFVTSTNQNVPATMRWLDALLDTETMFSLYYGEKDAGARPWLDIR